MTNDNSRRQHDRKEYLNGAGKDTYCHTDNKTTAEPELRTRWDSDSLSNCDGCARISLAQDGDFLGVDTSAQARQRGFRSSGEPPARDGQGPLPIDDAHSPGTLHRA